MRVIVNAMCPMRNPRLGRLHRERVIVREGFILHMFVWKLASSLRAPHTANNDRRGYR